MDAEKLRNLTDTELLHQQRELNDQLFRLKFQLRMGQAESLNKIRGLRKDVARVKTIIRQKELGISTGPEPEGVLARTTGEVAETVAKPKKRATKKPAAKKAAVKKSAGAKAKARK
jgi:large subunit ribosomal protein L29